MKKVLFVALTIFIASIANAEIILSTTNTKPISQHNMNVLNQMHIWDRRIRDVAVTFDNTVVIIANWPRNFAAENVESGWCIEFDNDIDFIQLWQVGTNVNVNRGTAMC